MVPLTTALAERSGFEALTRPVIVAVVELPGAASL